jgi:ribose transport system permease protein
MPPDADAGAGANSKTAAPSVTDGAAVASLAPSGGTLQRLARSTAQLLLPAAGLLGLSLFLAVASPNFLRVGNLRDVLSRSDEPAIAAIGMTWVMVGGGIDLSVGSMMGLCGVLSVSAMVHLGGGAPIPVLIATGLGAGLLLGLVNGGTTIALRVQPFIVTLGTLGIYRGAALLYTNGVPLTHDLPASFGTLTESVHGIPIPLVFVAVVAAISSYALRRTRLGRHTYAIGSNSEAARLSGIPVQRSQLWIYGIGGALTGLAAVLNASRVSAGDPNAGDKFELYVIAAVVIGGGSLSGGVGTVAGSVIGALLIEVLRNGCVLLGIGAYPQYVVIGAVVVLAVAIDELRRRRSATR